MIAYSQAECKILFVIHHEREKNRHRPKGKREKRRMIKIPKWKPLSQWHQNKYNHHQAQRGEFSSFVYLFLCLLLDLLDGNLQLIPGDMAVSACWCCPYRTFWSLELRWWNFTRIPLPTHFPILRSNLSGLTVSPGRASSKGIIIGISMGRKWIFCNGKSSRSWCSRTKWVCGWIAKHCWPVQRACGGSWAYGWDGTVAMSMARMAVGVELGEYGRSHVFFG